MLYRAIGTLKPDLWRLCEIVFAVGMKRQQSITLMPHSLYPLLSFLGCLLFETQSHFGCRTNSFKLDLDLTNSNSCSLFCGIYSRVLHIYTTPENKRGEMSECVDRVGGGLDVLCWGIGKRWKECKMCIGVVYLDLIREVCFVRWLKGTYCCTVSFRRPA